MKVEKFIDSFQPNIAFYMETNDLISTISQLTGFYMKCNSRLNGLKSIRLKLFSCNNCCILSLCCFKKEQSVVGVELQVCFPFSMKNFCAALFRKYSRRLLLQKQANVMNSI